uniref:Ribosomal silencing factor RsfS n=1 Tax=Lotharella globosa TaxID=91324 RepID=A0A7S4DS93_9EUKA
MRAFRRGCGLKWAVSRERGTCPGKSRFSRGFGKAASPYADPAEKSRILNNFVTEFRRMNKNKRTALTAAQEARSSRRKRANKPRDSFAMETRAILESLEEGKCFDVEMYHTQQRLFSYDLMIVASGFSERQLYSVGYSIAKLAAQKGFSRARHGKTKPVSIEDGWVALDCKDVMVHLMTIEVREKEEWESHFANERVPKAYAHNPLDFNPTVNPEPDVAWFEEAASEEADARVTEDR